MTRRSVRSVVGRRRAKNNEKSNHFAKSRRSFSSFACIRKMNLSEKSLTLRTMQEPNRAVSVSEQKAAAPAAKASITQTPIAKSTMPPAKSAPIVEKIATRTDSTPPATSKPTIGASIPTPPAIPSTLKLVQKPKVAAAPKVVSKKHTPPLPIPVAPILKLAKTKTAVKGPVHLDNLKTTAASKTLAKQGQKEAISTTTRDRLGYEEMTSAVKQAIKPKEPLVDHDRPGYVMMQADTSTNKPLDDKAYEICEPNATLKYLENLELQRQKSKGDGAEGNKDGHRKKRMRRSWLDDRHGVRIGKTKLTIIAVVVALVLLVIVGAFVVGAYFLYVGAAELEEALAKSRDPPLPSIRGSMAKSSFFRDDTCLGADYFEQPRPECIFSPAPKRSDVLNCSRGECLVAMYVFARRDEHDFFEPRDYPKRVVRLPTTNPVFCRASENLDDPMRVCVDGKCNHKYEGHKYEYKSVDYQGQWRDNCDKENPCWRIRTQKAVGLKETTVFNAPNLTQRDECVDPETAKKMCPKDNVTAAVVWMEHLYCDFNPSGTGEYCQGLPLRLWECAECEAKKNRHRLSLIYPPMQCKDDESYLHMDSDNCTIACVSNGTMRHFSMPDGAGCLPKGAKNDSLAYCWRGACFPVDEKSSVGSAKANIKTLAQCVEDQEQRKKYWQKFL